MSLKVFSWLIGFVLARLIRSTGFFVYLNLCKTLGFCKRLICIFVNMKEKKKTGRPKKEPTKVLSYRVLQTIAPAADKACREAIKKVQNDL
jgi:hypothetical protein